MFGYVRPCISDLSEAEKERYRAVYCGVCRALGRKYGSLSRLSVNFDVTFLALMLSSLYEPEEQRATGRCLPHPIKPHPAVESAIVDYAADMTVALVYHKFLDDWHDERKAVERLCAKALEKHYRAVQAAWPRQCAAIEESVTALSVIEKSAESQPDDAINCSGRLLEELFVWKDDFWSNQLRWFGRSLGRFIYLMDAAVDYDQDVKRKRYNPLAAMKLPAEQFRETLIQPLGEASEAFEALPLVQDDRLMRNILYSGVWQAYNEKTKKQTEAHDGQRSV